MPIDNCLVSGGLVVRGHDDGPSIGSDHFPLVVDLAIRRSALRVLCHALPGR